MFKKFISWLLISSANPEAVSLTVKGILVAIAPYIVNFAGLIHLSATNDGVSTAIVAIVALIQALFTLIGSTFAVYGFVRKLILTHTI